MTREELVQAAIATLDRWNMEETGLHYSPTNQEIQMRLAIDVNVSLTTGEISDIRYAVEHTGE